MEPDFFARTIRVYWDLGYQLHIHVNGDAGLDMVLDQLDENISATRAGPPNGDRPLRGLSRRPGSAHQAAGAIVSGNPYYPVALADNYRRMVSSPSARTLWSAWAMWRSAGILFSFHSDMPMAPGQPLLS